MGARDGWPDSKLGSCSRQRSDWREGWRSGRLGDYPGAGTAVGAIVGGIAGMFSATQPLRRARSLRNRLAQARSTPAGPCSRGYKAGVITGVALPPSA